MEKTNMNTLYIYKKGFEENKEEAINEDFEEETYTFSNGAAGQRVTVNIDEIYFDEKTGELHLTMDFMNKGEDIAYTSLTIPLDIDVAKDIVQYYLKKLGQLKSVLEIAGAQK